MTDADTCTLNICMTYSVCMNMLGLYRMGQLNLRAFDFILLSILFCVYLVIFMCFLATLRISNVILHRFKYLTDKMQNHKVHPV